MKHPMKFRSLLLAAAFIMLSVSADAEELAKPKAYLEVRAMRESAIYQRGEDIVFQVRAFECTVYGNNARKVDGGKPVVGLSLKYEIVGDGGLHQTGDIVSADEPIAITTRLDRPGFVLCTIWESSLPRWWQYKGRGGAGVEPLKIEAAVKKPADFNQFWQKQLDELYAKPIDVIYNEHTDNEMFDQYRVKLAAPGHPISGLNPYVTGWMTKPKNARMKAHPAILHLPGAGVRSPKVPTRYLSSLGFIEFAISVHGFDPGDENYGPHVREQYEALPKNNAKTKEESLMLNYERIKILRVMQALRYLKNQPEWDGKVLIVSGGSQGGGLTLIATGLDPDVTACMASYPGYCDQYGYLVQKPNGWPQMLDEDRKTGERGKFPFAFETAAYFDAAVFALKIKADTVVTTGFIDRTCPPSSVYAAYNRIPASYKEFHNGVTNGHEGPRWSPMEFVTGHLERKR